MNNILSYLYIDFLRNQLTLEVRGDKLIEWLSWWSGKHEVDCTSGPYIGFLYKYAAYRKAQ